MSILLTELTKWFGDNLVVNKVSLEVQDRELFVLLGASGSGKSTVLRMIAGLSQPDSGKIELNGRDVTNLPPQKRGTGFVFQNYSIFRHMTVSENIEFGLRIRKKTQAERRRRSDELLELVGLTGLGARLPDQLSGGQRQRVALARALAYEPDVLLLDEPFGALDVKIRAQLREGLKEIQRRLKVTTLLVTHDQDEAFELGDRIGVMERGALVEVGRPEDLYHKPGSEYAATFIGGGNVLVGRISEGSILLGSTRIPFPEEAPPHDEGVPVRILFRPETVVLHTQPMTSSGDERLLAPGRVVEKTFAGSQVRIRLEVDGLTGARPISPAPVYGQVSTIIDVFQNSSEKIENLGLGQQVWIGLTKYHVLAPTGLKILVCLEQSPEVDQVASYGGHLSEAAGGPTMLLSVMKPGAGLAGVREDLEGLRRRFFSANPLVETRARQGQVVEEILSEAQEGSYELLILGKNRALMEAAPSWPGSTARQLLYRMEMPILLVAGNRPAIRRILICTAAGEPGKSDVRFGGRMARQIHAQAMVFHVLPQGAGVEEHARAERHLDQARASLEALGIASECKMETNVPLLDGILAEAESGDYDLVVIGAPAPRGTMKMLWPDLPGQIVRSTGRPVLVVPMFE
jgi:sulfate/thiosulfate transport system ATP-binding protein